MPEHPRSLPVLHDCGVAERPCPHVECRHHLANGERPRQFARRKDASATCSLDVAAGGGLGLTEVGDLLGLTMEAARQVEARALKKLALGGLLRAWRGHRSAGREYTWDQIAGHMTVMLGRQKSGPKHQEANHG